MTIRDRSLRITRDVDSLVREEISRESKSHISKTIAERTGEILRRNILELNTGYRPGDRLYPLQIASQLGVSITPVREALKVLAADGLVLFSPRRGATVVVPTIQELGDLLAVQEGLEHLALSLVLQLPRDSNVGDLEWCLDQAEVALERGQPTVWREMSADFHRRLVRRARNRHLTNLYSALLNYGQVLEVYYPRTPQDQAASIREHRRLAIALTRTADQAIQALADHWVGSRRRLEEAHAGLSDLGRPALTQTRSHDGRTSADGARSDPAQRSQAGRAKRRRQDRGAQPNE
jgi:DNA-binding GntR family transcriptional regulator